MPAADYNLVVMLGDGHIGERRGEIAAHIADCDVSIV